jgi:hypothetical protein
MKAKRYGLGLGVLLGVLVLVSPAFAIPTLTDCRINVFEFVDYEVAIRDGEILEPGTVLEEGDVIEGVFDLGQILVGNSQTYNPEGVGEEITGYFYGLELVSQTIVDPGGGGDIQITQTWDVSDAWIEIYWDPANDLDLSVDLDTAIATATDGTPLLLLDWTWYESYTNAGPSISDTSDDDTNVNSYATLHDDAAWAWNDTALWDMELWPNPAYVAMNMTSETDDDYERVPFVIDLDVYGLGNANFTDALIDAPWITFFTSDDARAHPVPEPATMLLVGSGLLGGAILGRRKLRKKI